MNKEMVKFIRQMSGLTQTEFAEKLGYSAVYCSYLETGARAISKKVEMRIMEVFRLNVTDVAMYKSLMEKIKQ